MNPKSLEMKGRFGKFVQRLKKSLGHLASDKSHGVAVPLTLDDLPEECISNIISFTSPQDACALALVSKSFESAVNSDIVWERFIPPEYENLISRSEDFSSKKELYFAICHESVQIDNGNKILNGKDFKPKRSVFDQLFKYTSAAFSIDSTCNLHVTNFEVLESLWVKKATAKRCNMLSAVKLSITWSDSPDSWKWITLHESKLIIELLRVNLLEIRGRIESRLLSPRTRYSAYIVFEKADICYGFKDVAIEAVVGVVGQDLDESCRRYVCFDEAEDVQFLTRKNLVKPVRRDDRWMEIKLGEFYNQGGLKNKNEIEMVVLENKLRKPKCGLIIQGIEIHPANI